MNDNASHLPQTASSQHVLDRPGHFRVLPLRVFFRLPAFTR